VIEATLSDFLAGSRAQDSVIVFFVGHAVEVEEKPYLVPLEGEMDRAETLVPLEWVLGELSKCKARQKVLVLDTNRFSPTGGSERPGSGPMGAKFFAAAQAPPPGVQVLVACSAEQQSYETDKRPVGVFLDALWEELNKVGRGNPKYRALEPFALAPLVAGVNAAMKNELAPLKLTQEAKLFGTPPPENGVAYDPKEPVAALPKLPDTPMNANAAAVKGVLQDIGLPPIKVSNFDTGIRYELLPAFDEKKMARYTAGGDDTPLRKAVREGRAALWAVSGRSPVPPDLADLVKEQKAEVKTELVRALRDGYDYPQNENQFKNQVFNDGREVAKVIGALDEALSNLKAVAEQRDNETKRWQANYDFTLARLEAQIAYLYEYQSRLGEMRKEVPALDRAVYRGWTLASTTEMTGDSTGKRLAKSALKGFEKIAKEHKDTPYAVLAKREALTALGLEWKPKAK
jgi:hypothetical protein